MQDIIDRAVEAEAKLLDIPVAGPVMAAASWATVGPTIRAALQSDTATTEELLAEAGRFDPTDKHYPFRVRLQLARLRAAWRAGR